MRLLAGIVGFAVALLAPTALSEIAVLRSSFALNHAAMLVIFVLGVESLSRAFCGLEHLAGFDTEPIIRNVCLSQTVSEFWRRYNRRIHEWLYRNVFQATGGRHTPIRSMLLVFLARPWRSSERRDLSRPDPFPDLAFGRPTTENGPVDEDRPDPNLRCWGSLSQGLPREGFLTGE